MQKSAGKIIVEIEFQNGDAFLVEISIREDKHPNLIENEPVDENEQANRED